MEPLMPSEVARLVYGYLKKEDNDTAECFLKSSPHLTECYQMFKVNRNFNIKVNGFNLHDIFDIFGTMCSMINERVSEAYESKTMIEKLQYLLDLNQITTKEDKCIETELNVVDKCIETELKVVDKCIETELNVVNKCIDNIANTKDKSIFTTMNIEVNNSTSISLCQQKISNNIAKTKENDTIRNEISTTIGNLPISLYSSPFFSPTRSLLNNNASTSNCSKVEEDISIESPKFQINEQVSSTPAKKLDEIKNNFQSTQMSPKNIQNQFCFIQSECQQIPVATSLESMPGLSKEDRPKDSSVVIDTGELVDTFLNDQSLLEKLADTINKSIEAQKETDYVPEGKILDPPTLEKALDSTQSDPQIKNILDEFLVFNVDNSDDKKKILNDQQNSIKSRLRSAKKKDDASNKYKKNNLNNSKTIITTNEESLKIDNNIILLHDGNMRNSVFDDYNLLSNQFGLQSNDCTIGQSLNFETVEVEQDDDCVSKLKYVKIAPKITPIVNTHPPLIKPIFPKRRKRTFEEFGIVSKFRRTNINIHQPEPIQSPSQSIIIEVPNQSSFETHAKSNININNIKKLPEVSKVSTEVKDVSSHDTPDDRLKPPKSKSLSTPRRRSTHIRCLDFSTPQAKNNTRDHARSKLFCDTPKRIETIIAEEPSSSPLPKLQVDWGSVNGFESIAVKKKETIQHWDTDIREMVGAGILTSDADGRKTRKKKTPRKKIKPVNDKNNSDIRSDEQTKLDNDSIQTNEPQGINKSNIFENPCNSNEGNSSKGLITDQITELCNKSDPLKMLGDVESLKNQSEFLITLETQDKITELGNIQQSKDFNSENSFNDKNISNKTKGFSSIFEPFDQTSELYKVQSSIESESLKSSNNKELLKKPSEFSISLETPNKISELYSEQSVIESSALKNVNDEKLSEKQNEFPVLQETSVTVSQLCDKQLPIETSYLKSLNDTNLLKKPSIVSTSLETFDKNIELCNKLPIKINSSKQLCKTQNNLGQSNIDEKEENLNHLNSLTIETNLNTSHSKLVSDITNKSQEKDSNFLESFKNHKYSKPFTIKQPENKSDELIVNLKPQSSMNKIETNKSTQLNSPENNIKTQHDLIETPYKCDDAVDVPETPISKLIREYDPSKLVTPLPSTPTHYEDSLTETPLTKVFRETSYLNRPPISPFPPTPGNSRSIDNFIVPPEQEGSKSSININSKINGFTNSTLKELVSQPIQITINNDVSDNKKKGKSITPRIKTKVKNGLKGKNVIETKKKQVYESVKVELFGSEISSSSSADELEKNKEQHKSIVINKKLQNGDKKSGFKPIPKRKSTSVVVSCAENCSSVEVKKPTSIKSTKIPNQKSSIEKTKNVSNIKVSNKSKKSMVHFDDPVEKSFDSPIYPTSCKSYDTKINSVQKETIVEGKPEQLIGLSRYLKKQSPYYESKKINIIKPKINTCKLNNSDTNINYSEKCNINISKKKISEESPCLLDKTINIHDESMKIDRNNKNIAIENNTILNKSDKPLNHVQHMSYDTMTNLKNSSKNKVIDTNVEESNATSLSCNSSMKNTSCVTVGHIDESFQLMKEVDDSINIELLKKLKVYEVVTEDSEREMVYLSLSETYTFLDLHSELNNLPLSNSPLITNKVLDVTTKVEPGEIADDNDVVMPLTSTPKDIADKKSEEKQNRARRSPSLWDDSIHNYPIKYRDDRHRDLSNRRRNNYRYDTKYRPNKSRHHDEQIQYDSRGRFQENYIKREFRDDLLRHKDRFKYKEDKRRSYRDYNLYDERKGRDYGIMDESERIAITHRTSQKLNKAEDYVKKAIKRSSDRAEYNTPAKKSKVEHQRLLKNVDVDDFLSVVHGRKN